MKENAIIYCQGAFNTTNGKTAHGLVRFTERYNVIAIVDSKYAGQDTGDILDGIRNGIPVVSSLQDGIHYADDHRSPLSCLVIGLAPDGGRLPAGGRKDIIEAIENGLNIISGLHDYFSEDPEISGLAKSYGVKLTDIRKTPPKDKLHFFSGKINDVNCLKLAVLGTDSALGKRTTAWILVHGLMEAGYKAEMVGTGQTAWMQGAKYGLILDTMINDFLSGEIEHAIWSAWNDNKPDVIVIEGQGSLLNPAYPGGYEILAAGHPDYVILQHAPSRKEYDGFPGCKMHPLDHQIRAIEVVSGKKVIALALNHENIQKNQIPETCARLTEETGIPCFDVLVDGAGGLVKVVIPFLKT